VTFSSARYSMPCPPPLSIDRGLFLSCAFRSLRVPSCVQLPSLTNDDRLSWGFLLLRECSAGVHLAMGLPFPSMFRPQCFSHSRRITPPCTLWAYCIPLPRSRFLFRDFPRHPVEQTFVWPYLLVVNVACDVSPSRSLPACRSVAFAPRSTHCKRPIPS
jgi:hypothetical protein